MYSTPDEVVLDPFMDSGTTAVTTLASGRQYVGFGTNQGYYVISLERIKQSLTDSHDNCSKR